MNQSDLVISFALEWPVYFVLYLVLSACAIFEVFTFTIYHYFTNRKPNKPPLEYFKYINNMSPN